MSTITPILKWAGGKRQLLPELVKLVPEDYATYCEPFVGGAALLLRLKPDKAIINDFNEELINVYRVVRDSPEALITDLRAHKNTSEYFYAMRAKDRNKRIWSHLSPLKRASRILYLNKTCFNGLYRVNTHGQFNVPFGAYKTPKICPEDEILAMSNYLNTADLSILCGDYCDAVKELPKKSFVYFDPPYVPVSDTASFTGYTKNGFSRTDQIHLRETCDELDKRSIKFMLSNSATEFVKEQYAAYRIHVVKAKRAINCRGNRRAVVDEVLVTNYDK